MQTMFSDDQLKDPEIARSNAILRSCVHCGFCTATCPTYQILGDELDSPRGRIYLIKDMLENERVPDAKTVKHIDRCLSCLACMTTCPSGVHYMHLIDHARAYINENYKRPVSDRFLRWVLAKVLPYPGRFRFALLAAKLGKPLQRFMPDPRLRAMLKVAPKSIAGPDALDVPQVIAAEVAPKMRVALLTGCAQKALNPDINTATVRLLARLGAEVEIVEQGCCGALSHHMGRVDESHALAALNIKSLMTAHRVNAFDAVVVNTSGCGTTVKDYGNMFAGDALAADAQVVADLAADVSEVIERLGLPDDLPKQDLRVTYHAACSLQHGQKVTTAPKDLLRKAGFKVAEPENSHLCCGSAGTYNLLQPEIAGQLQQRKVDTIRAKKPDVISAGNIGCMMQIGSAIDVPVVHTVELLDWATGGPKPTAMSGQAAPDKIPILR